MCAHVTFLYCACGISLSRLAGKSSTEPAIFHLVRPISLGLLLSLPCLPLKAQLAHSPLPLDARLNEQVIMVPAGDGLREVLETTVFRPAGPGPFPLLLMNHGKQAGPARLQQRERFIYMATEFVRRGYAVMLPMRAGFARSTGAYRDFGCDMLGNAQGQARDMLAALAYARRQSWVDPQRIVVAGQSYGGMAALALATRVVPGVRGVLNFSGGLRVDMPGCDWQGALAKTFATLGAYNHIPSLWLYGANDSYFGPALAQRLFRSFTGSGGQAQLVAYGPFKRDAHLTLGSRDGVAVWLPATERFLQKIGMPVRQVYRVADAPSPPATHFAPQDDIAAVPYLDRAGPRGLPRTSSTKPRRAPLPCRPAVPGAGPRRAKAPTCAPSLPASGAAACRASCIAVDEQRRVAGRRRQRERRRRRTIGCRAR